MSVKPRDVTPLIAWIRNTLSGRKLKSVHRFEGDVSPRSYPPAVVPGGPSHQLAQNWYCDRDGRRKFEPPLLTYERRALPPGTETAGQTAPAVKPTAPRPGHGYDWTTGGPQFSS